MVREQCFDAVASGDARALGAGFQPTASFDASGATDSNGGAPAQAPELRTDHEWLLPFDHQDRSAPSDSLIAVAIDRDQVDVLESLFSAKAIQTIGPKWLAVTIRSASLLAMRANALALLERLLVSPVFTQFLSGEQQQQLLDELLCSISRYHTTDTVRLLTAHGASAYTSSRGGKVRDSMVLQHAVNTGKLALVSALVRDGAIPVGACVLDSAVPRQSLILRNLLGLGCRPLDAAACFHYVVTSERRSIAKHWLQHGFVDVDLRNAQGQTPLIRVASSGNGSRQRNGCRGAAIAKLLLDNGASVDAKDFHGRTVLHHAVGRRSADVVRVLLKYGADPNQRTGGDHVPLDFLDLSWLSVGGEVAEELAYLLQFGASPFVAGKGSLSVVERLQESKGGQAFITSHPQWFAGFGGRYK